MQISRRQLLAGAAVAPFARGRGRPKIAGVITEIRKHWHGQHFVDRFLEGYGWNGTHHHPEMDLVSLFVDQRRGDEGDLTNDRAARFPSMKVYPTIAEALTLGGSKLAVDGVLLIGEHGTYPRTEKGQMKYPRYEFFKQIVKVYEDSGRTAPVFSDKHLSWRWDWAKEMYDDSKRLNFAFMAGSSLPVTWRTPSIEMPLGARVREVMCLCYGGPDGYDIHGLETSQCMAERRQGGETGVEWLETYRGDAFWQAYKEGVWPADLVEACMCRSHTLTPAREGFNDILPTIDDMRRMVKEPFAYRYRHADGTMGTLLMMNGLVRDFNFAARLDGQRVPLSTQMYLPMPDGRTTLANFFSPQAHAVEEMFLSGKPTYPLERTLLTTGLTATGVDSLHDGGKRIQTPHLAIRYQPTKESTYWRT